MASQSTPVSGEYTITKKEFARRLGVRMDSLSRMYHDDRPLTDYSKAVTGLTGVNQTCIAWQEAFVDAVVASRKKHPGDLTRKQAAKFLGVSYTHIERDANIEAPWTIPKVCKACEERGLMAESIVYYLLAGLYVSERRHLAVLIDAQILPPHFSGVSDDGQWMFDARYLPRLLQVYVAPSQHLTSRDLMEFLDDAPPRASLQPLLKRDGVLRDQRAAAKAKARAKAMEAAILEETRQDRENAALDAQVQRERAALVAEKARLEQAIAVMHTEIALLERGTEEHAAAMRKRLALSRSRREAEKAIEQLDRVA